MKLSVFYESIIKYGFTKACIMHKVFNNEVKEMYKEVIQKQPTLVNPFSTKQQIFYAYVVTKLKEVDL